MYIHIFQEIIDILRKRKKIKDFCLKSDRRFIEKKCIKTSYGHRHIYDQEDGNELIYNMLSQNKPFMAARFGTVEFSALRYFIRNKENKIKFPYNVRNPMALNAGFFPSTDYMISRFSSELAEVLRSVDIMGIRFDDFEEEICDLFCPNAKLIGIKNITPVFWQNPYSKHFQNKKVLIVNPFENSIKSQYAKRTLLFRNREALPEFELLTYKPVQSFALGKEDLPYDNWFEALDKMKKDISKIDFDIAVIGAGAYGIFLAQHCKELGKQAIHMGGTTQILFGIYGTRWQNGVFNSKGENLINEHWVRPSTDEQPKGFEKVEHACYW